MKLTQLSKHSAFCHPPTALCLFPLSDTDIATRSLHHSPHPDPPLPESPSPPQFMEGPGLAFAAFSQAVSLFPGSSFWAILFFLALVIMGLNTLLRILEGIVYPLQNSISIFRRHPKLLSGTVDSHPSPQVTPISWAHFDPWPSPTHRPVCTQKPAFATVIVCLGGFLGSLIFTSHSGSYIMSLFDDCLVPLILTIIVAFQSVALAWIYGARR